MVDHPHATDMVVKIPPRVPHEERALTDMDRDIIGRHAVRLELTLGDRYQVRRELEIWAGAVAQALAATHQPELSERLVLLSVRESLAGARLRTSRRYQGTRKNSPSPEPVNTNPQLSQPPQPRLVTYKR